MAEINVKILVKTLRNCKIDLPAHIDPRDEKAVREYVEKIWKEDYFYIEPKNLDYSDSIQWDKGYEIVEES